MARTQDSTKITFFANFLVFYDPDCTVLLVLLLLNHAELSVPLYVSNHVYFFIFFCSQLPVCGTGTGNCDFLKLFYMVYYLIK